MSEILCMLDESLFIQEKHVLPLVMREEGISKIQAFPEAFSILPDTDKKDGYYIQKYVFQYCNQDHVKRMRELLGRYEHDVCNLFAKLCLELDWDIMQIPEKVLFDLPGILPEDDCSFDDKKRMLSNFKKMEITDADSVSRNMRKLSRDVRNVMDDYSFLNREYCIFLEMNLSKERLEETLAYIEGHPCLKDMLQLLGNMYLSTTVDYWEGAGLLLSDLQKLSENTCQKIHQALVLLCSSYWGGEQTTEESRKIRACLDDMFCLILQNKLNHAEKIFTSCRDKDILLSVEKDDYFVEKIVYPQFNHVLEVMSAYSADISLLNLMCHAIRMGKKAFVKMILSDAENITRAWKERMPYSYDARKFFENLCSLSEHSFINLNEMNRMQLEKFLCLGKDAFSSVENHLVKGVTYTPNEILELTNVRYRKLHDLYNAINGKVDHKLAVLKELENISFDCFEMLNSSAITRLAERLSEKKLSVIIQKDIGIPTLSFDKAINLIAKEYFGCDEKLRKGICNVERVNLYMRCYDSDREKTLKATTIKELLDLYKASGTYQTFVQKFEISQIEELIDDESLTKFISYDLPHKCNAYISCLGDKEVVGFMNLVRAEVTGNYEKVKFHEGDIETELNASFPEEMFELWKKDFQMKKKDFRIYETAEFHDIMDLGAVPTRSCMNAYDGAYRECLLATFDTSRKLLYAEQNGRVVGRAIIRMTKMRTGGSHSIAAEDTFGFADVLSTDETRKSKPIVVHDEQLCIFLERPYIGYTGDEELVRELFCELIIKKAKEMGLPVVLCSSYHVEGYSYSEESLYISKTKAGEQYLDSLGGSSAKQSGGRYYEGVRCTVVM